MKEQSIHERYEETNKRYYEKFGEYYPNMPCSFGAEEQIEDMEKCIKSGKPAQSEPGVIY